MPTITLQGRCLNQPNSTEENELCVRKLIQSLVPSITKISVLIHLTLVSGFITIWIALLVSDCLCPRVGLWKSGQKSGHLSHRVWNFL